LQVGGWQIAVTVAWLGNVAVTNPVLLTLRFCGSVEAYVRGRPVIVAPLVSVTAATTVWGEFGVTVAVVDPLTFSLILAGGQVEKNPAADVTSEVVALMTVDPGRFAVAIPFGLGVDVDGVPVTGFGGFVTAVVLLIVTTLAAAGIYAIVPTLALGLVHEIVLGLQSVTPPGPVTVVSAKSGSVCPAVLLSVCPCVTHAVWLGIVIDVIGGCT
jgi:hypothetical protein